MADSSDVERHFMDLQKQLQEDGFDGESQVMKTTTRLLRSLKEDGFVFGATDDNEETVVSNDDADVVDSEGAKTELELGVDSQLARPFGSPAADNVCDDAPIVRAFRAKDEFDTSVITTVFASIEGWKTKVVEHKGSHFVIATNAQRLTDNRVKQAIVTYVQELKQAGQVG